MALLAGDAAVGLKVIVPELRGPLTTSPYERLRGLL